MSEQTTILCVDDSPETLVFLQECLRSGGYRVVTASNASEGYEVAIEDTPALVITDVIMPNESGYSLCKRLRENPSTSEVPILVCTVMEDELTALDAGATAFLCKPFNDQEVLEAVTGLLSQESAQDILTRAVELIRAQRFDEALQQMDRISLTVPEHSEYACWASYYRAQIFEHRGQLDRARTTYAKLLASHPRFWRGHTRLGKLLEKQAEFAEAHQHYTESLALRRDQPDIRGRVKDLQEPQPA